MLCGTSAFSPPAGEELIAAENVPPLDADFIKSLEKLGKLAGQIAHINDDKKWELGKLHKFKTKEIPAPAGGMTKVRHQQVQERDVRPVLSAVDERVRRDRRVGRA